MNVKWSEVKWSEVKWILYLPSDCRVALYELISPSISQYNNQGQGPVSRKSRKLRGLEKPFVKLRPAYPVKLVLLYLVKGIKIKITAKFRASRRLRFEDTKRMSPEMRLKRSRDFRETGLRPQKLQSARKRGFRVNICGTLDSWYRLPLYGNMGQRGENEHPNVDFVGL